MRIEKCLGGLMCDKIGNIFDQFMFSAEYHYFDEETDGMPIITLEVMPDSIAETVPYDSFYPDPQQSNTSDEDIKDQNPIAYQIEKNEETGMHFLADKSESVDMNENCEEANPELNVRTDFVEYTTRSDGSVCCKICGKILASRTHWYRHKYRVHVMQVNPAPLFQCEQCLIYFKSRKGYIGHIASKHSETLQDVSPVLTNAQAEALAKEKSKIQPPRQLEPDKPGEPAQSDPMETEVKKEPDPEQSIPKSVVPTYQSVSVKTTRSADTPYRKSTRSTRQALSRNPDVLEQANEDNEEWKEKRSQEEKLVADIIARVRRECEAQGTGGSARRGYSRKSGLHT